MSSQHSQSPKNQSLSNFFRWIQIWTHVIVGLAILFLCFPFANQKSRNKHIQNWSLKLLSIFGIELEIKNPEIIPSTPFLLASNHISWMDIHAINAFRPIRFVAKSEVANWPIFGWMAKQLGTVFIKRDNSRHARLIAGEVAKVLHAQSVCIFPEGTSTDGDTVLPFKPNLFESAIISDVPVYSLAISYKSSITGLCNKSCAFIGEMGLLESMSNILNDRNLMVELSFLPPSRSNSATSRDRKWLAMQSQEAISRQIKADLQLM